MFGYGENKHPDMAFCISKPKKTIYIYTEKQASKHGDFEKKIPEKALIFIYPKRKG